MIFNIKIVTILIIFSCVITAFECNSSDTKKTGRINNNETDLNFNSYFPLREGNFWKYINEAPRDESEIFIVKASDFKKLDNGIQVKLSSFPYITKESDPKSVTVKANGEIEIQDYMSASGVIIPSPENFKKGYKWVFGVFGGYVNGDAETVKTEAGDFDNCYYVMMTDGFTFSFEFWYKKDVGIVRWGPNRTNPPAIKTVYYVLTEYKLN